MDMRRADERRRAWSAAFACAVGAAIVLAVAGIAAPSYAKPPFGSWLAATLLLVAAAIAIVLFWTRRRDVRDAAIAAPTLAATAAKTPLEPAPEELRRQLETLRHTQGELLLAKQAAEAAMMAKGEFLATMSHEIRTPLNGVLPLLELVLSTPLQPDQRDYLSTAYASARELLRIVDAILDYSKLDAERLELETVGLNLRELVSGVAQLMQRNADAKGLRLSVTIDPNVRLAVRGDPVRLRQVLTNLVSNAIKFTERGGVHIQVSKRAETREHHEIVFAVRDSGIGIASDVAAKLFRPFSQADASTTRVFGGTGLGLAICKRLVDLMGGHLGVKSEPGKGSLFWFGVPLLKAVGDMQVRRSLDGIRALALVDDDTLLRRLQNAGATLGIEVTAVRTLADALAALRTSANMGERWRHAVLFVDAAAFKPVAATLVRSVLKDSALGHVRLLLTSYGGSDLPQDPRVRVLTGNITEEALRTTLEPMFGVEAPALARSEPSEAVVEIAGAAANTPLQGRVLLVEDNPVNQRVAQRLLDLHGLDVTAAGDGREAVERLEREPFDLVLMDCLMPVMDGYMATRLWRERERAAESGHIPIVAMTANAMAGDRERCLAAGMDDYISKPLDRAALAQLLRRWLAASRARENVAAPATAATAPAEVELPKKAPGSFAAAANPFVRGDAVPNAAAGSDPAGAPIDASIIGDLLDTMGGEFGDLVRVYLEDAPQRIRAIETAAETGDAASQIAPAHTLKSSSANIGATMLSELARGIEHAARGGIATGPAEIAAGVRVEYERVATELSKLLEKQ
jgi:signal transduction histidine kinase/CheY-like chemotaxis protein/HPt (histidine-containing phosphotransfer) domain-containing protein